MSLLIAWTIDKYHMNKKIKWYIKRLQHMNIAEMIWRFQEKSIYKLYFYKLRKKPFFIDSHCSSLHGYPILSQESDSDLEDYTSLFAKKFSPLIDFRHGASEDIRGLWEKDRLLWLLQLLVKQDNPKSIDIAGERFREWILQNPFLYGEAWTSVMEGAIRGIQLVIADHRIKSQKVENISERIMNSIRNSCINIGHYISKLYSRFSSANNHLIVEMVALGLIGLQFDCHKWVKKAINTLQREIILQFHEDGVNKEQSIHYHAFCMEALLIFIRFCEIKNKLIPDVFYSIIKKSAAFLSDMADMNGNVPDLGDDDEGKLIDAVEHSFNYYTYVLQFSSLVSGEEYAPIDRYSPNLSLFFSNGDMAEHLTKYNNQISKCYQHGGHTILKYRDTDMECIMTLDHGPLGFGSIAAHGHADALSITLSINGEKIIVDPGTYIYHIEPEWRDYFRKTIHHNTIEINGMDQSEMQGSFLWGKRANAYLDNFQTNEECDEVIAHHDGYKDMVHRRHIFFYKPDLFIIIDTLESKKKYKYTMTYCLNSDIDIQQKNKYEAVLSSKKNYVHAVSNRPFVVDDCWISKQYASKEESKALKVHGFGDGNIQIITLLSINAPVKLNDNYVIQNECKKIDFGRVLF